MDLTQIVDLQHLSNMVVEFIPNLFAGLVILLLFWLLTRATRPALTRMLRRADFAQPLIRLLVDNVYRYTILGIGLVMAASQFGINVGAALTGFGVAGVAVGFAARETLANLIAGFLIFWDKPFQVGDYISTQGEYGEVRNITMRTTRIRTLDNTYVIVPNAEIIGDALVNHSMYGQTRIRVPVGIAYEEDVADARGVLLGAVESIEGLADDPAPDVVVTELAGSSVNLDVRVWIDDASSEKAVFFRTIEACKAALDEADVEIPFPHLQLLVDDVDDRVWEKVSGLPRLAAAGGEDAGRE